MEERPKNTQKFMFVIDHSNIVEKRCIPSKNFRKKGERESEKETETDREEKPVKLTDSQNDRMKKR